MITFKVDDLQPAILADFHVTKQNIPYDITFYRFFCIQKRLESLILVFKHNISLCGCSSRYRILELLKVVNQLNPAIITAFRVASRTNCS